MRVQNLWGGGRSPPIYLSCLPRPDGSCPTETWGRLLYVAGAMGEVLCGPRDRRPLWQGSPGRLSSLANPTWDPWVSGKWWGSSVRLGRAARMVWRLWLPRSSILHLNSRRTPGPEVKQLEAEEGRTWLICHGEARVYVTRKSPEYQAGPRQGARVDTWKNVAMTTLPLGFVTFHFNFSLFLIVKLSSVPPSYFCLGAYKVGCQFP